MISIFRNTTAVNQFIRKSQIETSICHKGLISKKLIVNHVFSGYGILFQKFAQKT